MPREVFVAPSRPFAEPPAPGSLKTAEELGLSSANAWGYGVSTRLLSDPGRWELFNMIQTGNVWLDNYMLEIQSKLQAVEVGKLKEEVDFVDLVKTPGRNKGTNKSRSQTTIDAERLAKINALHFGELERHSPVKKPQFLKDVADDGAQLKQLPASVTMDAVRPEEMHVVTHSPIAPLPLKAQGEPLGISMTTSQATIKPAAAPSVASSSSERRFGPRPLPAPPASGMRSRTTSNASIISVKPSTYERPPSRAAVEPKQPVAVSAESQKPKVPVPAALRTPSPIPISADDGDDMVVDVEVPLNDLTMPLNDTTSLFPSILNRKPSFAALPGPSPLKRSSRGTSLANFHHSDGEGSSRASSGTALTFTKPPSANNGTRSSVRPSSGWLKSAAAARDRTTSIQGGVPKISNETALNTAANAVGASSGFKRKSEHGDVSAAERAPKVQKTQNTSFAMQRTSEEKPVLEPTSSKGSLHGTDDGKQDDDESMPHGQDEDDTAKRLMRLKGLVKTPVLEDGPASTRNTLTGTSDRTRVESDTTRISALTSATPGDRSKEIALPSSTVEKKGDGVKESRPRKEPVSEAAPKRKDDMGTKVAPPSNATIATLAASTTPPGSPVTVALDKRKNKDAVPTATVKVEEKPKANPPALVFKPPAKASIFSASTKHTSGVPEKTKQNGIFSRPPSLQAPSYQNLAGGSQTTEETESQATSIFDAPVAKGKTSISTFDTGSQSSHPANEQYTEKEDDFAGWDEEDGVTAGWMSKGDETAGIQRIPGAFKDEEENREEEPEDVTSNRWHALRAEAMADANANPDHGREETPTPSGDDEEMAMDEEDIEIGDSEGEPMEEEPDSEPPKPAAPMSVGGGIMASVGSLASKFGLKSLRMAAAAAEKEKTEKEKKQKEMEARRQAAAQKKAEEEARRKEEAERRRKLEEERRKKEKADTTLKGSVKTVKPLQVPVSEKKQPEIKRQPSKLALGNSTLASSKTGPSVISSTSKRAPTPTKAPSTIKLLSQASAAASTSNLPMLTPLATPTSILGPTTVKAGTKVTFKPSSTLPLKTALVNNGSTTSLMSSKQVQRTETTTSRVEAEVRLSEGGIDESADLPDIKSEYSDSEDEDRPRTYDPPVWAQSPDLRQALEDMRTVNPDTIFGAMPTLRMEEIFPGRRKSKFRARTSSANWAGTDGVTAEEEIEYARRMGFEQ